MSLAAPGACAAVRGERVKVRVVSNKILAASSYHMIPIISF